MIKDLFINTYQSTEQESKTEINKSGNSINFKIITVCVSTAIILTLNKYLGDTQFLKSFLLSVGFIKQANTLDSLFITSSNALFNKLIYWAVVTIFFYVVPPFIIIKLIFKEKLSSFGLGIKEAFSDYKLYIIMLLVMIPVIFLCSKNVNFQNNYPFYRLSNGESLTQHLIIWEIVYCFQFFALEFFFRGFLLHGIKNRFGFYSIFVMIIPYCMIHFGKPFPETLVSIIAGIVLGLLSLKSKRIWLGVLIHCSIALFMDFFALYQTGFI